MPVRAGKPIPEKITHQHNARLRALDLFPESPRQNRPEGSLPVAGKCDVCGKAKTFGNNVSFSKRRTSRDFKPNVHKKRIVVNGVGIRLNICTRCQRSLGKSGRAVA
jgi:large subunit ribosomal protein L28